MTELAVTPESAEDDGQRRECDDSDSVSSLARVLGLFCSERLEMMVFGGTARPFPVVAQWGHTSFSLRTNFFSEKLTR